MGTGKTMGKTDLGKGEETLGERDDVLHLSHCIDTVLHGLRVLGPRTVRNALDARNVVFGPLLVRQADSLKMQLAPRPIDIGMLRIKTQLKVPNEKNQHRKEQMYLGNVCKEDKVAHSDDRLLREHIQLLGDGSGEQAAAEDGRTRFGDQVGVPGQLVDDFCCTFGRRGWV